MPLGAQVIGWMGPVRRSLTLEMDRSEVLGFGDDHATC